MSCYDLNFYRLYRPELFTPNSVVSESVIYRSGSTSNNQIHLLGKASVDDVVINVCNGDSITSFLSKEGRVFLHGRSVDSIGQENQNAKDEDWLLNDDEKLTELNLKKLRDMDKSRVKHVCASSTTVYIVTMSGRLFSCQSEWKELNFNQENLHFEYTTTGLSHMMAITNNGDMYCEGSNSYGCCSGNNPGKVDLHNILENDDSVLDVYAAYYRTLAVTRKGKLLTTGWGVYTQQGLGNSSDNISQFVQHKPMNQLGEFVVKVALGALHTVVLTESRKVYGFGFNSYGQLSQTQTTDFSLPVLIESMHPMIDIWCGWHHSIFETAGGKFFCCGSNGSNELAGAGDSFENHGKNILRLTELTLPPTEGSVKWKFGTCSFSSVSFYHAIRLNGKRIERMILYMREMVRERHEFSDIIIV